MRHGSRMSSELVLLRLCLLLLARFDLPARFKRNGTFAGTCFERCAMWVTSDERVQHATVRDELEVSSNCC
jgi:hypothetical protein